MKHLLLFSLFLLALPALGAKSLVVTFKDGTSASFALSARPSVSAANDNLVITSGGTAVATFPLATVATLTTSDATAVASVKAPATQQQAYTPGGIQTTPSAQGITVVKGHKTVKP